MPNLAVSVLYDCAPVELSVRQCHPFAGRQPIGLFEVPCEMTLIEKRASDGGFAEGRALGQQLACGIQPPLNNVAIRAGSKHGLEHARKLPPVLIRNDRNHVEIKRVEQIVVNICTRRVRRSNVLRRAGAPCHATQSPQALHETFEGILAFGLVQHSIKLRT